MELVNHPPAAAADLIAGLLSPSVAAIHAAMREHLNGLSEDAPIDLAAKEQSDG